MKTTRQRRKQDLWKALRGRWHLHLCPQCERVYDDTCTNPEGDVLCRFCKGSNRPIWILGRDPRRCCDTAELVTSLDTRISYKLAGDRQWAMCPTCKRTMIGTWTRK